MTAQTPKAQPGIVRLMEKLRAEIRSPADGFTFLRRLLIAAEPQGELARVPFNDIFSGIAAIEITVVNPLKRSPGTSINLEELACLLAAVKFIQAKKILEIGTYDGNTALNIAANTSEDARITTVDLPPAWDGSLAMDVPAPYRNVTNRNTVGSQFVGTKYAAKITQVFGDSAKLNVQELISGQLDLAFIDGCHHRQYVQKDSENALQALRPGGLIMWHDYGQIKDVSDVVDAYAKRLRVHAIAGTRLAIGTA